MTSLSRILKPGDVVAADEVFQLPDILPQEPQPPLPQDTQGRQEQLEQEEAAAQPPQAPADDLPRAQQLESHAKLVYESTIRKAQEESDAILTRAREQAKREADQILQMALQEAEALGVQLSEQARRQAAGERAQEIQQTLNRAETALEALNRQHAQFMRQYEEELKWFALEIASKILHRRVEEDDAQLLELVKAAAESVKRVPWMTIQVSQEMTGLLAALQQYLAVSGNQPAPQVDILAIQQPPGSVLIETPEGIVDASVSTQLKNLKESFQQAENGL